MDHDAAAVDRASRAIGPNRILAPGRFVRVTYSPVISQESGMASNPHWVRGRFGLGPGGSQVDQS